jgi:phosphatidylserine decarboxylase
MNDIHYIDRDTKQVSEEKIYGRWALSLLYGCTLGARLFSFIFLPVLARMPLASKLYGSMQNKPWSKRKIAPFVKIFHIDTSEFLFPIHAYRNFNEFFSRKLKPSCRPIVSDPHRMAAPVDGRYLVIPDLGSAAGFYVKGQRFCLDTFLRDRHLAEQYRNGAMLIARLSPVDYHRFHFPVEGIPDAARLVNGALFSVNPIALAKRFGILWENKRMMTEIHSEACGKVLMAEIGATCVGTIHQTYQPGIPVKKGDEKGYFSFGGSCVVLIFEKGRVIFDQDLIDHSARHLETRCRFGTSLGKIT